MDKKKYFGYSESAFYPGKYTIDILDYEGLHLNHTTGSYNVFFARLLDMSYATWLRFCRDMFGAELVGKNSLYVVPYFKKDEKLVTLVSMLNSQANLVIWEREHPDFGEHIDYLKEKKKADGANNLW